MQKRLSLTDTRLTFPRRGVLSMELVLTLPILGILLFGIFEFSLLFFAQGSVAEASRLGARRATLQGAVDEDIHRDVQAALGRLYSAAEVNVSGAAYTGEPVSVAVAVPMAAVSPDLLWPIGFSLEGRYLTSQTRMVKE